MQSYLTLLVRLVVVGLIVFVAFKVVPPVSQQIALSLTGQFADSEQVADDTIAGDAISGVETGDDAQQAVNKSRNRIAVILILAVLASCVAGQYWVAIRNFRHAETLPQNAKAKIGYSPEFASGTMTFFYSMTTIDLSEARVTEDFLPDFRAFPRLHSLRIGSTAVTDKVIDRLAGCHDLQSLDISNTELGDPFIAGLQRTLPKIETLIASATNVSDESLAILVDFKKLTKLEINQTQVSADGVAQLREYRPDMTIQD